MKTVKQWIEFLNDKNDYILVTEKGAKSKKELYINSANCRKIYSDLLDETVETVYIMNMEDNGKYYHRLEIKKGGV